MISKFDLVHFTPPEQLCVHYNELCTLQHASQGNLLWISQHILEISCIFPAYYILNLHTVKPGTFMIEISITQPVTLSHARNEYLLLFLLQYCLQLKVNLTVFTLRQCRYFRQVCLQKQVEKYQNDRGSKRREESTEQIDFMCLDLKICVNI